MVSCSRSLSRGVLLVLALLPLTTGCADETPSDTGPDLPMWSASSLSTPSSTPTREEPKKKRPHRPAKPQFPNDPESLRAALVASGSACPSISASENWKGEPYYVSASSSWACDVAEEQTEFFMLDGSLSGDEWIDRFPQSPAVYSDSWVVLFPDGRSGDRASDRFLDYINSL